MKKYLLCLLLASFALAGCATSQTSVTSGAESTTGNTSEQTTSEVTPSGDTSAQPSSEMTPSSDTSDPAASESTSTGSDANAEWDDTSKEKFEQYFSGYAIPYVPMGTISYSQFGDITKGEDFYLDLNGTADANLLTFKSNAIQLGYVIKEYEASEEDPASVEAFYDFNENDNSYSLSITYSANDVSGSGSYMSIYKPGNKGNNSYKSAEDVKEAVNTACSLDDDAAWIELNHNEENPWYQVDITTGYDSTDEAMEACSKTYFEFVKNGVIAAQVTEEVTSGIDGYEFAFKVTTDKGDVKIYSVVIEGDTETDNCDLELQVLYAE